MDGAHLVFETTSGRFAVSADRVHRIVWLPVLSSTARDLRGQIGTARLHGEEVPVVDLDLALGQRPDPYTLDHRLIDVEVDGDRLGVVVRRVVGVREFDEEDLTSPTEEASIVEAAVHAADGLVEVVDVPELASRSSTADEPDVSAAKLFSALSEEELEELGRRQKQVSTQLELRRGERAHAAVLAEIGELTVAIPLDQVRAFVRIEKLTPVPRTPDRVLGLMNHRGEVVTIVDVREPLGAEEPIPSKPRLAALVELPDGPAGIAVDGAGRAVTIREDELDREASPVRGVLGSLEFDGGSVPVLDPPSLLRAEEVVVDQEA